MSFAVRTPPDEIDEPATTETSVRWTVLAFLVMGHCLLLVVFHWHPHYHGLVSVGANFDLTLWYECCRALH